MKNKTVFVTGIGTDVGKTMVSAILTEHFKADYWKPVQAGDLDHSDTLKIKSLISNKETVFFPETYRLTQPFSPHKSAHLDNVIINLDNIKLPETKNNLIIEGAGGLCVPLNNNQTVVDLIKKFDVEVVLVIKHYLGSINHTLLSLHLLKTLNIKIKALIFNGETDKYSEEFISAQAPTIKLIRIPFLSELNKTAIKMLADSIKIDD